MKKLLTVAALASAAAAYAVDIEVGTVGVTKITSSAENTIVVTSYGELSGESSAMAVSNIVKTAGLSAGDKLYVLTSKNAYEGYTLTAGAGGAKYWQKDLNYTVGSDGSLSSGTASTSPSIPTLTTGSGFWLKRQDTSKPIVVYGLPPATSNVTVSAKSTVLVGNMTQTDKAPTITGMAKGDKIYYFKGANTLPTIYSSSGSAWRNKDGGTKGTNGEPLIAAGTGFWYVSTGNSAVTIAW